MTIEIPEAEWCAAEIASRGIPVLPVAADYDERTCVGRDIGSFDDELAEVLEEPEAEMFGTDELADESEDDAADPCEGNEDNELHEIAASEGVNENE